MPGPPAATDYDVRTLRTPEELDAIAPAWDGLVIAGRRTVRPLAGWIATRSEPSRAGGTPSDGLARRPADRRVRNGDRPQIGTGRPGHRRAGRLLPGACCTSPARRRRPAACSTPSGSSASTPSTTTGSAPIGTAEIAGPDSSAIPDRPSCKRRARRLRRLRGTEAQLRAGTASAGRRGTWTSSAASACRDPRAGRAHGDAARAVRLHDARWHDRHEDRSASATCAGATPVRRTPAMAADGYARMVIAGRSEPIAFSYWFAVAECLPTGSPSTRRVPRALLPGL